jgi:hypothetical protein
MADLAVWHKRQRNFEKWVAEYASLKANTPGENNTLVVTTEYEHNAYCTVSEISTSVQTSQWLKS